MSDFLIGIPIRIIIGIAIGLNLGIIIEKKSRKIAIGAGVVILLIV